MGRPRGKSRAKRRPISPSKGSMTTISKKSSKSVSGGPDRQTRAQRRAMNLLTRNTDPEVRSQQGSGNGDHNDVQCDQQGNQVDNPAEIQVNQPVQEDIPVDGEVIAQNMEQQMAGVQDGAENRPGEFVMNSVSSIPIVTLGISTCCAIQFFQM